MGDLDRFAFSNPEALPEGPAHYAGSFKQLRDEFWLVGGQLELVDKLAADNFASPLKKVVRNVCQSLSRYEFLEEELSIYIRVEVVAGATPGFERRVASLLQGNEEE